MKLRFVAGNLVSLGDLSKALTAETLASMYLGCLYALKIHRNDLLRVFVEYEVRLLRVY